MVFQQMKVKSMRFCYIVIVGLLLTGCLYNQTVTINIKEIPVTSTGTMNNKQLANIVKNTNDTITVPYRMYLY
jgi:uncharacterized protein YcfL